MTFPNPKQQVPLTIAIIWLVLIILRSFKDGVENEYGLIVGTLVECTTPGSLLVLPVMAFWYWAVGGKKSS